MEIRHLRGIVVLSAAAALVACAGQPPAPPTPQASEVPAERGPAAAGLVQTTIAGIDVRELVKRMKADRLTDYHIEDDSYVHYVGGELYARYKNKERLLILRPDAPPGVEVPQCEIRLLDDGGVEAKGEVCGNLLTALQQDLENDRAFVGN